MEKIQKLITKYLYLIIILLSVPAIRYLFVDGYFGVSDDLHIGWLYEMDRVVKMLQFPPRFVPDLSYGFGYPLFNFVYPLPFYIAETFHLIGFSLVNSIKIVFGLSIPFSMYFMYRLLKHYLPTELSLSGAILYVYAPYRALEIFVRGTIGEIVAFVFFPLIVLSYIKITNNEKNTKWIGIAGLSTAALVLSHNIMAYMFMPFLILFVMARILLLVKDKKQAIFATLTSLGLGLLSSIYFWLPAIYESKLMHYDTVFNFYDHYPSLIQFITPYWGYGASVPGPYDTMSLYMGLVGFFVIVLGSLFFILNRKKFTVEEKILLVWVGFVFLVSIFMMNFRSAFLWRNLPLLPYFQFPWRFLAMVTFVSPIFLLGLSKFSKKGIIAFISLVVSLSALIFNFNYFKTSEYLGRQDDYYINRYIPSLSVSDAYKQTSEEYLRLPLATTVRPDKVYPRAYADDQKKIVKIEETNALNATITTKSDTEFKLNYNKYNYPGWISKIDGKYTEIVSGQPFGQVSVVVPSGEHVVEIAFKETKVRFMFNMISLIALATSLVVILKKEKNL